MKKILSILLFFTLQICFSQQAESTEVLMKRASEKAKKENKNVFVKFSASWCIWCKRMDAGLHDTLTEKIFDDRYIFQTIIVSESKGKEHLNNLGSESFKDTLGGREMGLPYWVVLTPEGKLLANSKSKAEDLPLDADGENVGCPASPEEIKYFIRVLKGTSKGIDEKEDEIITLRFDKIRIEDEEAKKQRKLKKKQEDENKK